MIKFAIGVVVVLVGSFFIAHSVIGFERIWAFLAGEPSTEVIEISTVKKTSKPNQYLVCPDKYCAKIADNKPPIFNAPVELLQAAFHKIAEKNKDFSKVNSDDARSAEKYISRSSFLRFPNLISVQYLSLADGKSTLAIYAQAQLGESDLGANMRFVDGILSELAAELKN